MASLLAAAALLVSPTDAAGQTPKPAAPTVTRTEFSAPTNPALDVTWTAPSAGGLTITGYKAQYRKKAAEGEDPASWTAYSGTLGAAATTFNLASLTAGATYEAQVRAVTSEEGDGPWSDTGEGTANRPPNLTGVSIVNFSLQWYKFGNHLSSGSISGHFQDADGDAVSYSASSQYPGVIKAWIDGVNLKIRTLNPTGAATTVTYGASDAYGGYVSRTVDVTGTMGTVQTSIVENACCGRYVRLIEGVPYQNGALTYTLTGDAFESGPFVRDATTGWISLKSGESLDYETKSSYSGKLSWVVQGQTAAVNIQINVTDLEAGKPDKPTLTRTEFSEPTAPALDVTWTAPALTGEALNPLRITGYEAQYRKKAAAGEDPASWTAYSGTLGASATTFRLAGLEAGATYEAQVRAIAGVEGPGSWSDTGEGTANRPPAASSVSFTGGTFPVGTIADYKETGQGAVGVLFSDADSDALTYSAAAQHPALLGVSLSGAAGSAQLRVTLLNQGSSKVTYTARDAYGGSVTRTATIGITAKTSRSIAENSAAGTAVGAPVTGTPYNGAALTYSLTGNAASSGLFAIESATGQIKVATGATLDYETDDSHRETETFNGEVIAKFYRGKVNYTVDGHAAAIDVILKVTDVGTPKPAAPTVARTQFSEPTSPALDVTWTAPSAGGLTITGYKAQYRKKAAEGEDPASWTAYSGTLGASATTFNLASLTAGATYESQVRAVTSEEGEGPWSDTGEGTSNRPPAASSVSFSGGTLGAGGSFAWHEAAPLGSGAFFTDADGDALTYSAAAQHPALLGVSLTGAAGNAVLTANLLNQGSSKVTYTARDAYGGSVTRTATIGITAKTSRSIAENSAAGTAVGAPVTGTPYNGVALTYSLTGNAASSGLFAIESATGQIKVATGATLDYETDDSHRETETFNGEVIAKFYRGKVNYTVDGHAAAIDLLLKVTDVGTPKPAAPTVARTEFSEPTSPALDVTWTAPSAGGLTITGYKAQYRKKAAAGEDPASWTAYSGTLGATATTFNLSGLTAGATYETQVRAVTSEESEGPWSDTGEGTANRPPAASSASFTGGTFPVGTIADYKETGQGAVGVLFSDPDSDALTYSAAAQHPALLGVSLSGAAGSAQLRVTLLNQGSSKVTYTARDAYGGSVTRTATIGITAKVSRSIAENSAAGTAVGAPVTGTPYNGVALSYSLTGKAKDSGLFAIESATGQIKVATGATLDYETDDSHRETETWNGEVIAKFYRGKVNYTVDGHAAAIDVILKVTDVGTPKPAAPTVTRTEFSEPTAPALDVTWTAPSAVGLTITGYKAQYRKKAAAGEDPASWTAYSGTLGATATTFNLSGLTEGATYETQVLAVTSEEGDGPWSDTGEGTANRPPSLTGTSIVNFSLQWYKFGNHLSSGSISGHFQDADGDAISYSASSQYPGVIKAWIDGGNLKVRTLNPTGAATTVTYGASDAYGGYVSRTVDVTGTMGTVQTSIVENACCGRYVRLIKGVPYDDGDSETDDSLTYTLTGDAFVSGPFAHDATTGWISLGSGKSLDHETKSSYTATLSWVVQGQTASVTVNIKVTDLEAGKPDAPTLARTEYSEPTDPGLDVTWTAPALTGEALNPLRITGYEVQYRKKVTGGDANGWTLYKYDDPENPGTKISQLSSTTTSVTLPGLDAGATYEAQVRAIAGVEGPGSWSDTGEGTSNRPPAATSASFTGGTFPVGTIADYKETGQGAVGVLFSDPDSDALTYSAAAQHPALLGVSVTGAAGSAQLRVTLLNQGSSKVTYTARDAYGGSVTRTTTIGITAKTSRSIAENSAAGTAVGAPVTGTPYNGAALTYSLTGNAKDSGLFAIESATGQIKVATGATLDYETDDSHRETETLNGKVTAKFYRGKVGYTVDGNAATIDVNVLVTDVGTPKPAAPTVTRTEFSEPTSPALDVTWTAPSAGGLTITGYKAQYRKKAAAGEDPASWTAYSGTLGATATTFNLAGLTAGATYEAQVRAVTSEEGEGPWSDTGEATSNRPPAATSASFTGGTFPVGTIADYKETGQGAVGVLFSDPDSDALTYSAAAQHPALLGVSLSGAAGSAQLRVTLLNQGSSKVTYTASDAYGGSVTRTATIGITAKTSRSIVEHSPAGTAVGAPVTGTPYNGAALTYSLTGNAKDSGLFAIESTTGQIKVATGATLDYDTDDSYRETETSNGEVIAKSYRGKVQYTVDGNAAAIDVNILVTENVAPVIKDPGDKSYKQGASIAAFDVTVTDADGDTPTVTVTGMPSGLAYASGQVSGTVAQDAAVQDHTVTISADDGVNDAVTETFTVTVTDSSFAPVIKDPGDKSYKQGASIAAFDVTVTDADGDTPTVTVTGLPSGLSYASGQASGTVAQDAAVQDYTVTITANDGAHADVTETFTVTVADSSFAPVVVDPGDKTYKQGASITAFDVTVTDADGDTPTVTVTGLPSGLSYATGQVSGTVAQDAAVQDHTVTISADDGTNDAVTETFTVTVADSSFAPVIVDPGDKTYAQGASIAAFDVTVTDADGDTPTVTVTGLPSGLSYASGQASGTVAQDAAVQDYTVTITANDGAHADVTETFTVTVTDVSFAPVIVDPGDKTYAQGASITAFDITVTDADGDTPTVTVTGLPSGLSYASGQVSGTVAQGAAVQDHTVTITANDGVNADVTEAFTVTVTDVNWPPRFTDPDNPGQLLSSTTRQVPENTAAGGDVGAAVAASDADNDDLSYSLSGTDASLFGIDATSGQITVAAGTSLDYEATQSYSVTVAAGDGNGGTASIGVTISVTDVDEPPAAPGAPSVTRASTNPRSSLEVSWTAPANAGRPAIDDYNVQYRKQGATAWTAHTFTGTGVSTTLTGLTPETTYEVQVQAGNDEGDGPWSDSGEAATEEGNRRPQFSTQALQRSVTENSRAGTHVGEPVTATDREGHPLTYGMKTPSSLFDVDPATGQITVARGASLDHEAQAAYTLVVQASDGLSIIGIEDGHIVDAEATVRISVTDVNEPPSAPSAPAVTRSSSDPRGTLEVTWRAPANTGPAIEDYDVRYRKQGASSWRHRVFTGTGTGTTVAGLETGTAYEVQVRAGNDEGTGAWSASGTGSTEANTPPNPQNPGTPPNGATLRVAENTEAGGRVGDPVTAATDSDPVRAATDSGELRYALSGTDASMFAIDANSGQVRVGRGTVLDYESIQSYAMVVVATDGNGGESRIPTTVAVTDVNEPPAAPAAPEAAPSSSDFRRALDASWTAPVNQGRPAIEDYDVRYRKQGASGWKDRVFTGTETRTTLPGLEPGSAYEVQVRAANDEGVGAWSASGTARTRANTPPGFVQDPDDPGTPQNGAVRRVAENTAAGGAVGAPVTAADADGDDLRYTLSGTDESRFAIDASSGQIRVGVGTALDYERTRSYGVVVEASDGNGGTGRTAVTIAVTDVNEPPETPAAPVVAPSSRDPRSDLEASWTAPVNTGRPAVDDYDVRYRKQGSGSWASHPFTGSGTLTTLPGLEPGTTYEVQVRAANDEGAGAWSASGTGRTEANTPPAFGESPDNPDNPGDPGTPPNGAARRVAENTAAGGAVGAPVTAADADGDDLSYALSGADVSRFAIDASSGQIRVGTGTVLDYETNPSHRVAVEARDGKGGTARIEVTISVTDVNEPPETPAAPVVTPSSRDPGSDLEASWTAPVNTGRPEIDDFDVRYRKQGAESWASHPFTGSATLTTLPGLESGTAYEVQVRAANDEGAGAWSASGTGRTEGNAPPVFDPDPGATTSREVAENTPAGGHVGEAVAAMGGGDDLGYSLAGTDAAMFAIDAKSGQITVGAGTVLDYETTLSYAVTVEAIDGQDRTSTIEVDIAVTDVAEPPSAPGAPSVTAAAVTRLTVAWTAPANAGRPAISGYDVQYRVAGPGADFIDSDFEGSGLTTTLEGLSPLTGYEVRVRALNDEGAGAWSVPGLGRTKANTAPTFGEDEGGVSLEVDSPGGASRRAREVAENTPAGRPVGAPVTATDTYAEALTYTLTGPDASSFAVDEASGQIRTEANLDYETRSSYSVAVEVSDGRGGTARQPVAIAVTDVAEPPLAPGAPSVTAAAVTRLTVAWTAPANAGRPAISGYDVQYRVAGPGADFIDSDFEGPGLTTTLEGLSPLTAYEVRVRALNHEGAGAWSVPGLGRTKANTAPTFGEDEGGVSLEVDSPGGSPGGGSPGGGSPGGGSRWAREVAENTPAGRPVGAPVTATDTYGEALTYTLTGLDASSFAVDEASGQIRTEADLDYETRSSYSVAVEVSDGHGGTARQPVAIAVTDVAEPPSAPGAPAVTAAVTRLTVAWTAPANAGRPAISGYEVQYRVAGLGADFIDSDFEGPGLTTTLEGLSPLTAYEVRVRALNDEGAGDWSVPGTGRTLEPSPDATLSSLAVTTGSLEPPFSSGVSDYSVSLGNSVPSFTVTPATGHTEAGLVYRYRPAGAAEPLTEPGLSGEARSFELAAGTNQLTITVTAQDQASREDYTMSVTRQANEPPRAPALTDRWAVAGRPLDFQVAAFTNPDAARTGQTLRYQAALAGGGALPEWLTFTPATRTFSGTPPAAGTLRIEVTATDDGVPALSAAASFPLTVTPAGSVEVSAEELTVAEGEAANYAVALGTAPEGPVRVAVEIPEESDLSVSPRALIFTPANWSQAQTVTVTAAQDADAVADTTLMVTHLVSGGDYDGVTAAGVAVSILEDDTPGVTVSVDSLTVTEGGAAGYTVVLQTEPAGPVTVAVEVPAGVELSVTPLELRFTAADWNRHQSVTVTAADDEDALIDAPVTLTHAVSGGDYGGVSVAGVEVSISEDESPALTITGATVTEGTDSLTFLVSLNMPGSLEVRVDWRTADGTATAGEDYTAASGTLTIPPGGTEQAISVAVFNDALDETDETFSVVLSNPVNAVVAGGEAAGTILDNEASLEKAWLVRLGRTAATQVMDAVSDRLRSRSSRSGHLTVGGQRLGLGAGSGDRTPEAALYRIQGRSRSLSGVPSDPLRSLGWSSPAGLLSRSSFLVSSGGEAAGAGREGRWTAWGQGRSAHFQHDSPDLELKGGALTSLIGIDWQRDRLLAGLVMAHNLISGEYDMRTAEASALRDDLDNHLASMHPYFHYALSERLSAWGVTGYGRGRMGKGPGPASRGIVMGMGGLGVRGDLGTPERLRGFDLAVRSDAFWVGMDAPATPDRPAVEGAASRARLALEGARPLALSAGRDLSPSLEMGLRFDGGDAETGVGMEIGGGLGYTDPGRGLSITSSARRLMAHRDDGYEEWGMAGSVTLDPGRLGRGASLRMRSSWGAASSGIDRLMGFSGSEGSPGFPGATPGRGLNAEVGYGLDALGGVLTPYADVGMSGRGQRNCRLGWRLQVDPGLRVEMAGSRRELAAAGAAHEVRLRATFDR